MGGVGRCDWSKCLYFAKAKLKIHVRQLRSIPCPKIYLWALLEIFGTTMVQMCQNPMAHYCSYTLGSSVLYEWESQIIPRPPSLNAWICGKLKTVIRATCGRPTLLTIAKGGWSSWRTTHEWSHVFNISSTKHMGGGKLLHEPKVGIWDGKMSFPLYTCK